MDDIRALLAAVQQAQQEIKTTQDTILERINAVESSHHATCSEQVALTGKLERGGRVVEQLEHKRRWEWLLGVFELAEQVLLQVDEPKFLSLQRYSQFKAVIDGSPLLQRKLFRSLEIPTKDNTRIRRRINYTFLAKSSKDYNYRFFNSLRPALVRDGHGHKLVLHARRPFPRLNEGRLESPKILKLVKIMHWWSGSAAAGSYVYLESLMLPAPIKQFALEEGFLQPEGRDLGEQVRQS